MINSFQDASTEKIWNQQYAKKILKDVQRLGFRKLIILHRAKGIIDLRVPPGNRLEKLGGERKGQHSIRINDQWRICFLWKNGVAESVEITDYH